jgi:hypothetical protein
LAGEAGRLEACSCCGLDDDFATGTGLKNLVMSPFLDISNPEFNSTIPFLAGDGKTLLGNGVLAP